LGDERTLTAGQEYHWAVEAYRTAQDKDFKVSSFKVDSPAPLFGGDIFKSVTVLTHGFKPPIVSPSGIPETVYDLAGSIANAGDALVMRYDRNTGFWEPIVDKNGNRPSEFKRDDAKLSDEDYKDKLEKYINQNYLSKNKPLVLLSDWTLESNIPDSGFSEAAADTLFASLVQLDQWFGGKVGNDAGQLYDKQGKLIRTQGAIFNSPLHFIGFSRGTIVNSEIVQRLGTFFPYAGGLVDDKGNPIKNNGKPIRDLQMTMLDPHDFKQPSLELFNIEVPGIGSVGKLDYSTFYEPKIQVWDNVTFADNYYQTVPALEGRTFTPFGRDIPRLPASETYGSNWPREGWRSANPNPEGRLLGETDLSILLGTNKNETGYERSRAGFTKETDPINAGPFEIIGGTGGTHGRVLTWYAGTANLGLRELPDELYRRKGDAVYEHLFDKEFYDLGQNPYFNPWYVPDHEGTKQKSENSTTSPNIPVKPNEGIGNGWFYSALGGGKDLRPTTDVERVPVDYDNTHNARMRGDFAVPTLFNGNFDAVTQPKDAVRNIFSNEIPGWSYHGGQSSIVSVTDKLAEWNSIPSLSNYRTQVGYDPKQPNYALELESGDSITHNRFVVPDWGALRFDLHVPDPESATAPQNSVVRVFLDDTELQSSAFQGLTPKERQANGNPNVSADEYPAVDLREFNPNISEFNLNPKISEGQSNRIGFAQKGFQTFQVDIPNEFRGKMKTLRFEVSGRKNVYLDNVFFKSQNLLFGNPTLNGQEARKDIDTPEFSVTYQPIKKTDNNPDSNFSNNYLIERPQYSLSYYNEDTNDKYLRKVNWVSYQLNKSWVGNTSRTQSTFYEDPKLPFNNQAENNDFTKPAGYSRGHMATFNDRSRNQQDYLATFLTSNVIPQPININKRWGELENYLTNLAENKNKEIYIIAGGNGQGDPFVLNNKVLIPDSVWKVVLILDKPGQGIADVTKDTLAFALYLPNTLDYTEQGTQDKIQNQQYPWQDNFEFNGKGFGLFNIRRLEEETGYNFFSNLPIEIQDVIEKRKVADIKAKIVAINSQSAPLMAAFIWYHDQFPTEDLQQ
jgi:DNA/RNA endonuclease G (NUC1)